LKKPSLYALKTLNLKLTLPSLGRIHLIKYDDDDEGDAKDDYNNENDDVDVDNDDSKEDLLMVMV
jgi:hypothetical protein